MKVVLFNAQSVGSSNKRSEISCFVEDNDIDFLFIVETWLHHEGDEAKCFDLCPLNYEIKCVTSHFQMNFPESHSVKYINRRNLSGIDSKKFRTDIVSASPGLSTLSSNDFDTILRNILDEHAPIQRIRLPARKTTH